MSDVADNTSEKKDSSKEQPTSDSEKNSDKNLNPGNQNNVEIDTENGNLETDDHKNRNIDDQKNDSIAEQKSASPNDLTPDNLTNPTPDSPSDHPPDSPSDPTPDSPSDHTPDSPKENPNNIKSETQDACKPDDDAKAGPSTSKGKTKSKSDGETSSNSKLSYITGLLEEILPPHLEDDEDDDDEQKPIKHQSFHERVTSLKAVEGDLQSYFHSRSTRKFSLRRFSVRQSADSKKLSLYVPPVEKEAPKAPLVKRETAKSKHLSSSWQPVDQREKRKDSGVTKTSKHTQSWVGSYDLGEDYWSAIPEEQDQTSKPVKFSLDEESERTWYDMPVEEEQREVIEEREKEKRKIKEQWIKNIYKKQKGKSPTNMGTIPVEYTKEFQVRFQNYARGNDFSADGTYMSLANSDKWLERAYILDYSHVSLLHTGFSFLAAGGGKFKGLKIDQYLDYLRILAGVTGITFADIVDGLSTAPILDREEKK